MATISFATKKPKTQEPATETQVVKATDVATLKSAAPAAAPVPAVTEQPKSTISFSKPAAAPAAKPEEPKTSTAVARQSQNPQLEGEFGSSDIAIPYLALTQKMSACVDDNPEWLGKWVYDKTNLIGDSARVVIVRMTKRYEEDLPYGSQEISRRFKTAEEARAEGVRVRDVADIDLLIEADGVSEDAEQFGAFIHGGKTYLPARYTVRSGGYGATVRIIMKDLCGWLKNDLSSGFYLLQAEKKKNEKGSWFAPKPTADGKVPEALRAMIAERFQN